MPSVKQFSFHWCRVRDILCISKHCLYKSINTHNNLVKPFLKMLQLLVRAFSAFFATSSARLDVTF